MQKNVFCHQSHMSLQARVPCSRRTAGWCRCQWALGLVSLCAEGSLGEKQWYKHKGTIIRHCTDILILYQVRGGWDKGRTWASEETGEQWEQQCWVNSCKSPRLNLVNTLQNALSLLSKLQSKNEFTQHLWRSVEFLCFCGTSLIIHKLIGSLRFTELDWEMMQHFV